MNVKIIFTHLALGVFFVCGCSGENADTAPWERSSASGGLAGESGGASSGGASIGGEFSAEGLGGGATGGSGVSMATGGQSTSSGGHQASGGGVPLEPPKAKLERVLAYNLVDVNPKTGKLRGHTGVGEDEKLLESLGKKHGFSVEVTDDPSVFTPEKLSEVDVLVFSSPHYAGQKISKQGRDAIEAFVRGGGGWIGFHYALKVELGWPFRKVLGGGVTIGAHAKVVGDTYSITSVEHPTTAELPKSFQVTDDYLKVNGDLRAQEDVLVLATAQLAASPGAYSPTIWAHEVDKGRVFYSMPGHNAAPFKAQWYQDLVWGALRWTAKLED